MGEASFEELKLEVEELTELFKSDDAFPTSEQPSPPITCHSKTISLAG